ncbi:MAG: ABC transporter substrate-binding protein [Gemmatimonadaceae bacterium]|nr:ABC transporter substrate-binding protein [Gemmatimonadaceae bacterium]
MFSRRAAVAILIAFAACTRSDAPPSSRESDDFGDAIASGTAPVRIVSLNPATTDLLFALGVGQRMVGRTHWDLYPDSAKAVTDLGTGLRPNIEAVLGVKPDLVVLYASQDNRNAARQLRAAGVNTISLKIDHIADFHRAARLLGRIVGDSARGAVVSDSVARTIELVRAATEKLPKRRVFWHIWDAPLITIAAGSYMTELITIAGGENIYSEMPEPSPTVSIEDVLKRNPEYIISGPEGAIKIRSDPRWSAAPAVKAGRVLVADTTLVGRPSVRLGEAAASLAELLHPGVLR